MVLCSLPVVSLRVSLVPGNLLPNIFALYIKLFTDTMCFTLKFINAFLAGFAGSRELPVRRGADAA